MVKQHTFTGTLEGFMAESVIARIRVNCVGSDLPDVPDGTHVTVTWDEAEPTDVIERAIDRLRDRIGTSAQLWSNEDIAQAVVRELDQAGWRIVGPS